MVWSYWYDWLKARGPCPSAPPSMSMVLVLVEVFLPPDQKQILDILRYQAYLYRISGSFTDIQVNEFGYWSQTI